MADGFNETPVKGKHSHNSAATDATALATLPAIATNVDPTYTEGNVVALSTDLTGRLRVAVESDSAAPQHVIVDSVAGSVEISNDVGNPVPVSGTVAVSGSVEISNDAGNALPVSGTVVVSSITAEVEVKNDTGNPLSVAQTVRGAAISDSNPLPVNLQENPGTTVDSGVLTTASVAPGASTNLTGPTVGTGLTAKLIEVTASASVRIKVVLKTLGTGAADKRVFFVKEGETLIYSPKDRDLLTASGAAGAFRVTITNMDNLNTADVYASIAHVEV